jgi:uncharacterized protein (TIGR02646 family)
MKRIEKSDEPPEFTIFRSSNPDANWERVRIAVSTSPYENIRNQCIADQGGLCGFCEIQLPDTPLGQRVEHFHPKSDTVGDHNWALYWNNMLAVCIGGSNDALTNYPGQYLEPLRENLSCDAHKDHLISKGKLSLCCEGYLLNPMEMPAFPCLFNLDKQTGELIPDQENCSKVIISPNQFPDTEALVDNTIRALNLNCDRLTKQRRQVLFSIEREKKNARQRGQTRDQLFSRLAVRYFRTKWPSFFTTRRILLGRYAETCLQRIPFDG